MSKKVTEMYGAGRKDEPVDWFMYGFLSERNDPKPMSPEEAAFVESLAALILEKEKGRPS